MKRKGVGYMIEAFMASLTLFVFAASTLSSPAATDWTGYQSEVTGRDIGHALKKSGHLESFASRGETGSIRTASRVLSGGKMTVSGSVEGLPTEEKKFGYHVPPEGIHLNRTVEVDGSRCDGDLEEIDSEYPVRRTRDVPGSLENRHEARLYIADIDPSIPDGFNSEEDYDSIWVDNGTLCQFSASEGPYAEEEFFFWNGSASSPSKHYDLKKISDDGTTFSLFEADKAVELKKTMKGGVNGIQTDTSVDTFNFSNRIEAFDAVIFAGENSFEQVEDGRSGTVLEYMEEGAVLMLLDLTESGFEDSDLFDATGMEWIDLGTTSTPERPDFTGNQDSQDLEKFFKGQKGEASSVKIPSGARISSGREETINDGEKLVVASNARYETGMWNASNFSMETVAEDEFKLENLPEKCETSEYRNGSINLVSGARQVVAADISCGEIWGVGVDIDQDSRLDDDEKIFLENQSLEIDDRRYRIELYRGSEKPGCETGECVELVYSGSSRVELINYRKFLADRDLKGFARLGYKQDYNEDERKLIASVLYLMTREDSSFGRQQQSDAVTNVVGGVENQVYMPYRVNLRWRQ